MRYCRLCACRRSCSSGLCVGPLTPVERIQFSYQYLCCDLSDCVSDNMFMRNGE
jgi:hypothetical protein